MVRMWIAALRVIPRVSPQEWRRFDLLTRWLISTRAAVFVMTFVSATIGGLFAAYHGQFHLGLYLLTALGLILAHGASNLFNDLFDYKLGLDEANYFRAQYGPQPLVAGLLTERALLRYAAVTLALAAAIGAYLTWVRGPLVFALAALGLAAILGYSFSKRIALGEPLVIVVWGPLMVAGSYFVITGHWRWEVFWAGLVYALGPTSVLFGKHIDKFEDDRKRGIRTLPILLGKDRARRWARGLMLAMYLGVGLLVVLKVLPWPTLLVVLAWREFREAWKIFGQEKPKAPPPDYPPESWPLWYVAYAFVHNRRFGLLFVGGLLLGVILRFFGLA